MEFTRVTDVDSKDFKLAMEIYSCAFPVNEQQPVDVVKERVRLGLNHVYVGRVGDDIAFIALLWPLKNTGFILLEYMATSLAHRGKNIGSQFLESIRDTNKHFIIEVENPEYGDNREDRQRRLAFYKKNGAKELKGVRYVLPGLQGLADTEMRLMIFPDRGRIKAVEVKELIIQIYRELYGRDANESVLKNWCFDSETEIELI